MEVEEEKEGGEGGEESGGKNCSVQLTSKTFFSCIHKRPRVQEMKGCLVFARLTLTTDSFCQLFQTVTQIIGVILRQFSRFC